MRARFVRHSRHPRAEITCPPLRWRTVGRRAAVAMIVALTSGVAGVVLFFGTSDLAGTWKVSLGMASVILSVTSALWLTHLLNAARTPVTFKVANGELWLTRPFLFMRRSRRIRTTEVRDVTISPRGRLSIRRRLRPAVRVRGGRPLNELHRVAEELRSVLHV